jgi:hypothetical protein
MKVDKVLFLKYVTFLKKDSFDKFVHLFYLITLTYNVQMDKGEQIV